MSDKKETARTGGRETRAHQIEPPGVAPDRHHCAPQVTHEHEQGRARWMRHAQHFGGGDEFARIPQRDGGREIGRAHSHTVIWYGVFCLDIKNNWISSVRTTGLRRCYSSTSTTGAEGPARLE